MILHRDIGYLSVALILVYGISGLAVNHVADWNPNFDISKHHLTITPITAADDDSIVSQALNELQVHKPLLNHFRPDSETVQLFFLQENYSIDLPTGNVIKEQTRRRHVLFEMNQLHLNAPKGIWTYIADLFAISLIFMGISGIFILRGSSGVFGRGKWLLLAGTIIPLGFWIAYLYF